MVAEEVRRLAERSRESVDSVRTLLDEFSSAIRAMVVSTEEGTKSAIEVLDQSRATQGADGAAPQSLSETATGSPRNLPRDGGAARRLGPGGGHPREVSEVIQRMAEGLDRFTGAAEQLDELALSIQLLTQTFRLDSTHSLKHRAALWARRLVDHMANPEAVEIMLEELLGDCPYLELAIPRGRGREP